MITLLLAMTINAVTATHVIPLLNRDNPLAFEITVPGSWGYSDKLFSVSHYRDVLVVHSTCICG